MGQNPPSRAVFHQQTLDALFEDARAGSLRSTTFVVVDLETTGSTPSGSGITEIGAVKVRGGECLGEFATLVNPQQAIPPYITALTGITQAMVADAPTIATVLPSFLEFAAGAVLVAHNAPFDIGFLKAACAATDRPWPKAYVLDTVPLSRRTLQAGEVANHKLATLSRHFGVRTPPTHRALDDARATVEVLHALLERLGSEGIGTLGDVLEFARPVSQVQRTKRHLADGLPDGPGVYIFRDRNQQPLYIGTSTSISTRVRSYFTAAEKRARMTDMLRLAERVEAIECATALESEVRELRLIAAQKPPFNRRSKYPERQSWLKLTAEAYPRLSITGSLGRDKATYLGPFAGRRTATMAAEALHEATGLRECTQRLSPRTPSPPCAMAELGRCLAPCQHRVSPAEYAALVVDPVTEAMTGDPATVVEAVLARIESMAAAQRYEDAAGLRERLAALLRGTIRMQRLLAFTALPEVVAARPVPGYRWEISVVRYGRLAAAAVSPPGDHPGQTLDVALATAETVLPGSGPIPCASAEETERILRWLELEETRLVRVDGCWSSPVAGALRWNGLLERLDAIRRE